MLFDISAFMQSMLDEYKKKFIYLNEFITNYKNKSLRRSKELMIDEIKTQLASNKKKLERSFSKLLII